MSARRSADCSEGSHQVSLALVDRAAPGLYVGARVSAIYTAVHLAATIQDAIRGRHEAGRP
ncbi:MAG: hypothetical protein ACR2PL_21305 [Dehalococcoidia bacterium]